MSEKIENVAEKAVAASADAAVKINQETSQDDVKVAMQAQRDTLGNSSAAKALPDMELFDSTDLKPVVDKNMGRWDKNQDNKLSKDELNAVLSSGDTSENEKAAAGLRRVFGTVDTNRDGNVDERELNSYHESAKVYERTRARVDSFTEAATRDFGKIDYNEDKILSPKELLEHANDKSNGLSESQRQILREFAAGDYGLVATRHDPKTLEFAPQTQEDAIVGITASDLESAGTRLRTKTVEGHRMVAPAAVHQMYRMD